MVPSVNSNQISIEVDNIQQWALHGNLVINPNKTKEIIIYRQGLISNRIVPPCMPGIQRVTSMKTLGVEFDETLSFKIHVDYSCNKAACFIYALKILRSKGIAGVQLWDITSQTLLAQMLYASQMWCGFLENTSRSRYESILSRLKKLQYLPNQHKSFAELCNNADSTLFKKMMANRNHMLHHLLPLAKNLPYDMRPRAHNGCLPANLSCVEKNNFIDAL